MTQDVCDNSRYLMCYVGGKVSVRRKIVDYIPPRKELKYYVEPFGGAGSVLLYKDRYATKEVYNDIDDRLVNLFNVIKFHPNAFLEEYENIIISRTKFYEYLKDNAVTDIQRAVQFFFVISYSFGAKGKTFAVTSKGCSNVSRFTNIHNRIKNVIVENCHYECIIKRYDSDKTFFYCDPPYQCNNYYKCCIEHEFSHEQLYSILKNIKGKFLLSYNDTIDIRNLYRDFNIVSFQRQNGIENRNGKKKNSKYNELLISNYDLVNVKDDNDSRLF